VAFHKPIALFRALKKIGWSKKRQTGSHRILERTGWPDYVFPFHDGDEIGPRMLLSMAARNSPESSGRNSPLYSDSVTAKSPRRSDIGEGLKVEIDDLLKRLGGSAVAQAVGPGNILGL
jgi:predicted RNA binding protein YcfA (HicA-like mRNA interferase family)